MSSIHVLCTALPHSELPEDLRLSFRDLDHFCRDLVSSALFRVTLVSPYWSPAGLALLQGALGVAAERGAVIRLIADANTSLESLRESLASVTAGENGQAVLERVRVIKGTELFTFIHAKLILVDGLRGYLGSANITAGGLERNFELGVGLEATQVTALERMSRRLRIEGNPTRLHA